MESNFTYIGQNDDLQDIFSKYGALALEKQELLSNLVGDAEPELDIEKGIVNFSNLEFPIQLIGYIDPEEQEWSWAWDNEDVGFPEELIEESQSVKILGEEFNISQFKEAMFTASLQEAHILVMTISSIFGDDAYCAANFGNFVFFVTIKCDDIQLTDDIDSFSEVYNIFHRRFEVDHKTALEYYAKLKGYEFKDKEDFSIIKIGEDRLFIDYSERGRVKNIKPLKA